MFSPRKKYIPNMYTECLAWKVDLHFFSFFHRRKPLVLTLQNIEIARFNWGYGTFVVVDTEEHTNVVHTYAIKQGWNTF